MNAHDLGGDMPRGGEAVGRPTPRPAVSRREPRPDISVVVVSFNVRELLAACLRSVFAAAESITCEIIVVDNASTDGSADMVARDFPGVTLLRNPVNRWLAPAQNQALYLCGGRAVLLLNPDTELERATLEHLLAYLDAHPDVGIVGPQLLHSDGALQPSGNAFRSGWTYLADALALQRVGMAPTRDFREPGRDYGQTRDVDEVSGACALIRHEVVEQVGPLDERLAFCYEDVDFCRRAARAGWRTVYYPVARVVHHGGKSIPLDAARHRRVWEDAQLVFVRKYHGLLLYAVVRAVLRVKALVREVARLSGPARG